MQEDSPGDDCDDSIFNGRLDYMPHFESDEMALKWKYLRELPPLWGPRRVNVAGKNELLCKRTVPVMIVMIAYLMVD